MACQETFTILIEVTEECRTTLELCKTIIKLQRPGIGAVTWTDAVEFLANTVPVRQVLADMLTPTQPQGTNGAKA